MLTRCINCGFYVKSDDEFCLNCGFQNPAKPFDVFFIKWERLVIFSLILTVFIVLTISFLSFFSFNNDPSKVIIISALSFLVVTIAEHFYSGKLTKSSFEKRKKFYKNNLRKKMEIIERRLSELRLRGDKIDSILSRIEAKSSNKLQEIYPKLLSARKIVIGQFARYELQRDKIELFAIQNQVSPVLFNFARMSDQNIEEKLLSIESAIMNINTIKKEITRYDATEFPERALSEKENFLTQLTETENSCEKLREALLSRQAARALHDISPIEENLKLPSAKEIAHAAESFNIQTTLTDFSESFDELEHEYKRLRAEEEVSQKLLDE
jgi:HPt (histidine-containing phosphotransfer) domain-containing protein